jgi:hypothetical protein
MIITSNLSVKPDQAHVPNTNSSVGILYGASCRSAFDCVAVGSEGASGNLVEPVAYSWDGTSWHLLKTPWIAAGGLLQDAAYEGGVAVAVGSGGSLTRTLIEDS